ncbi:MAG: hypothetical protein K0S74_1306 [Chlamydiales bacterium]|jgi:SsrA-binding protein|nr:hypothetical protein [Chlamydiales bacterium]
MSEQNSFKEIISNRKALHNYEILDTFEAGIVLQGTEIKSLRQHEGSLQEAYIKVLNQELWIIGSHIPTYRFGNLHNHEERRDRKLLMHKKEIAKLQRATQEKGLTLVPLSLYLKSGRAKIKLATARGKKLFDKREDLKKKDEQRTMQRIMKNY